MRKNRHSIGRLTVCLTVLLLYFTACKKQEIDSGYVQANQLLEKINQLRQTGCNCGSDWQPPVAPLSVNKSLQDAAQLHARDMQLRNYLEHVNPEGISPQERAERAGYTGYFRTENIGKGYASADEVLEAWRNSISHCKAMMDGTAIVAGIGYSHYYWSVSFGNPL